MGPEGNILANSSIPTFKQELTHSALHCVSLSPHIVFGQTSEIECRARFTFLVSNAPEKFALHEDRTFLSISM